MIVKSEIPILLNRSELQRQSKTGTSCTFSLLWTLLNANWMVLHNYLWKPLLCPNRNHTPNEYQIILSRNILNSLNKNPCLLCTWIEILNKHKRLVYSTCVSVSAVRVIFVSEPVGGVLAYIDLLNYIYDVVSVKAIN